MTIFSWICGILPMVLGMGAWLLTSLFLLQIYDEREDHPFRLVVRRPEDEAQELLNRIGWRGALAAGVAYQAVLAASYSGILATLAYYSPSWFRADDFNLGFTLGTAAVAAHAVVEPANEDAFFAWVRGAWRIPLGLLLTVPWWYFSGEVIADSLVADLLRKPFATRAQEFWVAFAAVSLWELAKMLFNRTRWRRNGADPQGS